jgi:hypothetical protein
VPVPLVSLALRRWRPLVRWQMTEMIPNDLPMKRGWSTAPHGPLTTFGQTRSQDALAPGAPPAGAPPRRPPPLLREVCFCVSPRCAIAGSSFIVGDKIIRYLILS